MNTKQLKKIIKLCEEQNKSFDLNEVKKGFLTDKYNLLTVNTKLKKPFSDGEKEIYLYGLELAPSILSGVNYCLNSTSCFLTCLFFSGKNNFIHQGKMLSGEKLSSVAIARLRRSFLLNNDPEFFYMILEMKIALISEVHKLNVFEDYYIRINVLSDLNFIEFILKMYKKYGSKFYDYTKHWERESIKGVYELTFSASEKTTEKQILEKIEKGENVAIVFEKKLPKTYLGIEVIDGDKSDHRMFDPKGVIVGLLEKNTIGNNTKHKFIKKEKNEENTSTNQK